MLGLIIKLYWRLTKLLIEDYRDNLNLKDYNYCKDVTITLCWDMDYSKKNVKRFEGKTYIKVNRLINQGNKNKKI